MRKLKNKKKKKKIIYIVERVVLISKRVFFSFSEEGGKGEKHFPLRRRGIPPHLLQEKVNGRRDCEYEPTRSYELEASKQRGGV